MPATAVLAKEFPVSAVPDSSVVYAVERLSQVRSGVEALMQGHAAEFTYYRWLKGPADPDWNLYANLEFRGLFKAVTARSGSRLVGYFFIVFNRSPHFRKVEHVFDDTFYLAPEFRAGWGLYRFVKYAVEVMEHSGAAVLVVADKVKSDLAPIWKRLGFQAEEIRYTKVARRITGE